MGVLKKIRSYVLKIGIPLAILFILYSGLKDLLVVQKVDVAVKSTQIGELTTEQKLEDFNYMFKILSESYPFFEVEKRSNSFDWLSHKAQYETWIRDTKNNNEFYQVMDKILTLLQNGHTQIISPEFYAQLHSDYNELSSTSWKEVIMNKKVQECYSYWKENLTYSGYYISISFTYIEGSYYAFSVSSEFKDFMKKNNIPEGSALQMVNGIPVDDYIKNLISSKLLSYDFKRNKLIINNLILENEKKSEVTLKLITPDNKELEKKLESLSYSYIPSDTERRDGSNVTTSIIEDKKTAYIKINSFEVSKEKDDESITKPFLYSIKDYPYLIVDIRGNSGGSYDYWLDNLVRPLISNPLSADFYIGFRGGTYLQTYIEEAISDLQVNHPDSLPKGKNYPPEISNYKIFVHNSITASPNSDIGFHGKIILLVDNSVYSSADAFTAFAKSTKWATIVGTNTGGDGIGFDPAYAALPNSGLLVRFPFDLGLNPDGTVNEEVHTSPDIYAEPTLKDYKLSQGENKKGPGNIDVSTDTILKKAIELTR